MDPIRLQARLGALRAFLHPAKQFVAGLSQACRDYPRYENVNRKKDPERSPRALLDYLVGGFADASRSTAPAYHQNFRQSRDIAAVLGECGYVVDVMDVADTRPPPAKAYDIVISHRVDFPGLPRVTAGCPTHVYLATGLNHAVSNALVNRRYDAQALRRGCTLLRRGLVTEVMPYAKAAEVIVGFGNVFAMNSWRLLNPAPSYPFNNYGFRDTAFLTRDFASVRKRFLFMASRAQVLKGLDLLLEVFAKHPELELYVCSQFRNEKDFCCCYRRELFGLPNVHAIGTVPMNSRAMVDIVARCGFIALPSCSEGQPGSVVHGMHTGLIPIVTPECGIDTRGFGVTLEDDRLATLEETILHWSKASPDLLKRMSSETRKMAETEYSEDAFTARWRVIIGEIDARRKSTPKGEGHRTSPG